MTDSNAMIEKKRVIIVDDEEKQRFILSEVVRGLGYEVEAFGSPAGALEKIRYDQFDLLLTDLQMPGITGLELLEQAKRRDPTLSIVMITGQGSIETAVDAIKKGADDYILKPVDINVLELVIKRIFKDRELLQENKKLVSEMHVLKREIQIRYHLENTVGKSVSAQNLQKNIERQIKIRTPLLITGEHGVGKEEIARVIHYNSPWGHNSLISFDAAEIPQEFHEVNLFGQAEVTSHPMDDDHSKPGLIERANQGTLVIHSIHSLDSGCQSRLLRVITEEKTQRAGGHRFYQVNTRIIAIDHDATIEKLVKEDKFRSDLYQILQCERIVVPTLAERKEDIPLIAMIMAKQMSSQLGKQMPILTKEALQYLAGKNFPGNSRELRSIIELATLHCESGTLGVESFQAIMERQL